MTWEYRSAKPNADHTIVQCAVIGPVIYAPCARGTSTPSTVFLAYDTATDTWATKSVFPHNTTGGSSEHCPAVTTHGGLIWAWGVSRTGAADNTTGVGVFSFDPSTNIWTDRGDLPVTRGNPTAETVGDYTYILVGGTKRVDRYDHLTNTYAAAGTVPDSAVLLVSASYVVGSTLYLASSGGVSSLFALDIPANTWSNYASGAPSFTFQAACAVNGVGWVSGGSEVVAGSTVYRTQVKSYNGSSWVAEESMPVGRRGHAMEFVGGYVWVIGGGYALNTGDDTLRLLATGGWSIGQIAF